LVSDVDYIKTPRKGANKPLTRIWRWASERDPSDLLGPRASRPQTRRRRAVFQSRT